MSDESPTSDEQASDSGETADALLASVSPGELPDVTESMRLVTAAQHGDDRAMNELILRYQERVRRIVSIRLSARLRRCVESVDIVQDVFSNAAANIHTLELRSTASIIQWLSRIAENKMHDTHRLYYGQKRDKRREVHIAEGSRGSREDRIPGVVVAGKGDSPAEAAARAELAKIVDEAVAELPDDYREVIMLRTYYGGSWEFVTREMGRQNPDATRQLHRRARIRLGRIVRRKMKDPDALPERPDGDDEDGE
ncbi:MAG: sigma-70 family RNA polymerase sigma factor [Planctomycetes bacterium]|nr:sigma-70 family RNA polymerase sigma factor [Planctomycetota bacterium]